MIRLSPISRPSDLPVLNPLAELKPEPASPPGGPAELPLARGRERSAGSGEPGRCMPRLSASRTTGPIARSGRRAACAALLLVAVLGTALPAAAQSVVTFVSNAGQGRLHQDDTNFDRAQAFTTGSNASGYTLSSAAFVSSDAQGDDAAVSLCEVNNSNHPTSSCTALSPPQSFTSGTLVFTAPANTSLEADTTYTLLMTSPGGQSLQLSGTNSNGEDSGGTAGWSIANESHDNNGGWSSNDQSFYITIKGTNGSPVPAAVSDVVVVPVPRTTDSLTVSWSAPDNAGKPALTGYDVRYRSSGGGGSWTTVSEDAPSTSLIIGGLRDDFYDVQVRALNADNFGPWSSTAKGATPSPPERVYANHPLIPDDLGPGDSFRLLYITGATTAATGTGIHTYHNFAGTAVLAIINPGNLVSEWGPISLGQTALVSTPGADARLLTDTSWTETDRGMPIYWLNGARVADDYADFYDGTWADEANPTNGIGQPHSLAGNAPWTGTDHDGTELFNGTASRAVGQASVSVGGLGSTIPGAGPLNGGVIFASTEERPLYGLWHVLVVDENLRLINNHGQPESASDGSDSRAAVRAQLFTTGPNSSGYGIGGIEFANGSDIDPFPGHRRPLYHGHGRRPGPGGRASRHAQPGESP